MTLVFSVLAFAVFVSMIVAICAVLVVQYYKGELADRDVQLDDYDYQLREADAELVNVAWPERRRA